MHRSCGIKNDNFEQIVILNPKGGSGKTTLATNIAAYYAMHGPAPALVDFDPQGFSLRWLDQWRVRGTYELVIYDLPYIVPYRIKKQEIHILSVYHTSGKWPEAFD